MFLTGRNEQRQHYLAGKPLIRQRALWVGEEMSGDGEICSLFMDVPEERGEKKKRKGWMRGKERKRGWDEKRGTIRDNIQKGRGSFGGGWGDRWYIAGILAKPICMVSGSVGDNVSSFPFCQIFFFTVHLTVSLPPLQSPEWRTKRRAETRGKQGDCSDLTSSDSSGEITANSRKICKTSEVRIATPR